MAVSHTQADRAIPLLPDEDSGEGYDGSASEDIPTSPVFSSRTHAAARREIEALLRQADVLIDGDRPWDIRVHNDALFARVLREGTLGLGESYMDGWWDAEELDAFFARVIAARLRKKIRPSPALVWSAIRSRLFNLQSRSRAFQVGERHYDIGNDLYAAMLDTRMTYSCGYWKDAATLDEAQERKLDLVCRKMHLQPGQRVLDIGCGWGSFAAFAAEKYGAQVTGITVSREQALLAKERCRALPVEIRLQDYRDLDEPYDHVISIGMFEHVGPKNYREYMRVVRRCLKDGGLFLLHTIGADVLKKGGDPWIDRYIFPNGYLPALSQISAASEGIFVLEDFHNFGADYDKTLMAWHANVERSWPDLEERYDERFHRMWRYYLLSCAALFRVRDAQLWQIILSKDGVPEGYVPVR